MNTRENHWQPVLPRITDPDMAPEEEFMVENAKATSAEFGANSAKSMVAAGALTSGSYMMNFFTQHKFKIIVAVVILLIALIILYMYITSKKKTDGGQPADLSAAPMGGKPPPNKAGAGAVGGAVGGASAAKSSDPSLEELNRVKEMRRQAKQLAEMKAANNASNPPNNAQTASAFKFSPTMVSPAMRDSAPANSAPVYSAVYSAPPMSTIFESVVDTPAAANNGGAANNGASTTTSTADAPVQKTIVPHVSDDEDVDNLVNELTDNIESIDSGEVE